MWGPVSPPGSLSLSLDAAALELMEALELLQERRERLEEHLRQGWLSLAQARYSLGCHRVSSLQYGATMVPRVRVSHRQDPGGRPHFEEVLGTGGDPEDPNPQQDGGLRQRRGAPEKGGGPHPAPPRPPGLVRGAGAPQSAAGTGQLPEGGDTGRGGGRAPGHRGCHGHAVPAPPAAETAPGQRERGQRDPRGQQLLRNPGGHRDHGDAG
ncbi:coiled-coil domain-containing protein 115-like [Corapipo altera]|uniref:coiled-coil domain-containing protein 115-like n=1 Tax=Corapipo altera TaxID=415028 RepID=UPI000FD68F26|nr:coiled-coil domain-containing protein 115-like [Corapipo altera]